MDIAPFKVEEWMNEYEDGAKYNIAETCVDSVSIDQLFELTGGDKAAFMDRLCACRLTYGDILGAPAFKEGIRGLFKTIKPENIVTTHGAAGANHHVYYSLVSPGDRVISVAPTYQQLYSIPARWSPPATASKSRAVSASAMPARRVSCAKASRSWEISSKS